MRRRHRISKEASSKPLRGCTYVYEISSSGKHQVCKTAFCNIHAISEERVRRFCKLLSEGKSPHDMRGKSIPGNTKSGLVIYAIKQHISSFPVKISHYSSKEYHYLSEKLDVKIMYSLFQEKYPEMSAANYRFYLKVFREHFSLSFGLPQVDTCATCEELDIKLKSPFLNQKAKKVAEAEKCVHLRRAKKFSAKIKEISEIIKADKAGDLGAICIDFMQNLQLPCIPVQEVFYLRQLTISVFCIHNLKDGNATFFVYHEGIATKGPNEVCSFVLEFLNTSLKGVKELYIFSDRRSAQNKNHTFIRMLSALTSLKRFRHIEHYFPIRGHSFLPCDRDFSVLKRKIKKYDRVYTIKEYVEIIVTSSCKRSFTVVIADSISILDFKQWWPKYFKRNVLSQESYGKSVLRDQKTSFKPSQFMNFSYASDNAGLVVARPFIDSLVKHHFRVLNCTLADLVLPKNMVYPAGCIPINQNKIDDLRKLQNYLPHTEDCQSFYNELFLWPTCVTEVTQNQPDD
ncbi:uncharacterized protein LOC134534688 [Bacillus rossius redtenbacheri]|uniref:uncharacterized protein LOC134534688 n=1 Tax=Bacillus rossius redtenbacheri TaxID=93214 RepID=UPI002FDDFFF4